jgi:hypothetical protein
MIQNIALFILGVFLFNFGQGTGGLVGSLIQPAGLVSILWSGWSLYKIFLSGKKSIPSGIPENVSAFKYKHFHGKTGIAIDTDKQEVHLKDRKNYKVYKYNEIRSWEMNVQTAGLIYGGGLNVAAANMANARQSADNTGLFIKVKDVDFPEWKISFPVKSVKNDLKRWMEILQQTLNES